MKRKFPISGQVKDVDGICWDVCDVRVTKYGFDLCFGIPAEDHGAYNGGSPRLIATQALQDFWITNRTRGHGFLFDLPAGRTTLKRVRRRLGFNFRDDTTDFWQDRMADLNSLAAREFAAKYDIDVNRVFDWRLKICGKSAREIGWWRKARIRKLLLSDLSLSQVGKKLEISISQAKRLRDKAKQDTRGSTRGEGRRPDQSPAAA